MKAETIKGYRLTNGVKTTRVFLSLREAQKALTRLNQGMKPEDRFGLIEATDADVSYLRFA